MIEVAADSAGSVASIQPYDLIIEIDGQNTEEISLGEMLKKLRRSTACKLGIKRGAKILTVSLMPRSLP